MWCIILTIELGSLIAIFYYFLIMESFNQENHGSDNYHSTDNFRNVDNLPLWSEP